jgi:CxxH/CxxC protein (TIGR04129 family)
MELENQYPVWYACEEHVDMVIDEIVDHYSKAPTMDLVGPDTAKEKKGCIWCGGIPRYQLEIDLEEES